MNLYIRETYVNLTKNYRFNTIEWYETGFTDPGKLYKHLQREGYGKATTMYADIMATGKARKIGWVFAKRMAYSDALRPRDPKRETYIREVWVEVSTVNPDAVVTPAVYTAPHSPWERAHV